MADTKVAVRRLPFAAGTKMVFAQASVPPDWTLDVTDNDKFLRVVSGAGGGTGGPDNSVLSNNNTTLSHEHTLGSHVHNMASHDHTYTHSHSGPSITGGMVTSGGNENSADYRLTDDSAFGWRFRVSGSRHLAANSNADEGEHDHSMFSPASANAITQGSNTTNTGGPSGSSSTTNLVHNHSISSSWRPRYLDVVVGTLVG